MSRNSKETIRHAIFTEIQSKEYHGKFERMKRESEIIADFINAAEVVDFLHDVDEVDFEKKDSVLYALISLAKLSGEHDRAANTLLVGAMWPGLDRISKQLDSAPPEIEDSFAEVYYALLEEIQKWGLQKREKIAVNILLNTRKRALARYREFANLETVPFKCPGQTDDDEETGRHGGGANEPVDEKSIESEFEDSDISSALNRLVAKNVIGPQDSLLIALHIFQERELIEIAESYGLNYKTVCKRYERAIKRLKKFFGDGKGFRNFIEGG